MTKAAGERKKQTINESTDTGEFMSIYESLNNMQQEAVYHTEGPLLILAGEIGRAHV